MDHKIHLARIFSLLILLFFLAWTGNTAKSLRLNLSPRRLDTIPFAPQNKVAVRVYFKDLNDENQLASRLDVVEVHEKESYLLALLSSPEWQDLSKSGHRLEIDGTKNEDLSRFPR